LNGFKIIPINVHAPSFGVAVYDLRRSLYFAVTLGQSHDSPSLEDLLIETDKQAVEASRDPLDPLVRPVELTGNKGCRQLGG